MLCRKKLSAGMILAVFAFALTLGLAAGVHKTYAQDAPPPRHRRRA